MDNANIRVSWILKKRKTSYISSPMTGNYVLLIIYAISRPSI